MAGRSLITFAGQPEQEARPVLGERRYRVELRWRWRLASWYASVWHADGTPVALCRRLSPGFATVPDLNVEGVAGDMLITFGADGYAQGDLGESLRLLHYTSTEVPEPAAEVDAPVIEL